MNKRDLSYIDAYLEMSTEDDKRDMEATRNRFKPKEVEELGKSHEYWQEARLKAWSEQYVEKKRNHIGDAFEYLI